MRELSSHELDLVAGGLNIFGKQLTSSASCQAWRQWRLHVNGNSALAEADANAVGSEHLPRTSRPHDHHVRQLVLPPRASAMSASQELWVR